MDCNQDNLEMFMQDDSDDIAETLNNVTHFSCLLLVILFLVILIT